MHAFIHIYKSFIGSINYTWLFYHIFPTIVVYIYSCFTLVFPLEWFSSDEQPASAFRLLDTCIKLMYCSLNCSSTKVICTHLLSSHTIVPFRTSKATPVTLPSSHSILAQSSCFSTIFNHIIYYNSKLTFLLSKILSCRWLFNHPFVLHGHAWTPQTLTAHQVEK